MQQNQRMMLYILLLIAALAWTDLNRESVSAHAAGIAAPQAGFKAPDFSLKGTDGQSYTLSQFNGKPVLVNLWATWCPPCRAEMQTIEKIYEQYKSKGFVVLAVNMTYQDDPTAIASFAKQFSLTFPILIDEYGDVAGAYQLRSMPSSFFINRSGMVDDVVIGGPMSEALLRARVEAILQ